MLCIATQSYAFDGTGYCRVWPAELASPGVSDRAQGIPIEVGNRVWSYMMLGFQMFTMDLDSVNWFWDVPWENMGNVTSPSLSKL